ncbi:MAG: hypothetical protein K2M77_01015, partial [Muribaculaceae bacterium]|nr:hypothetical protein [Muribaculaceae bacterium]
MKSNSSGKSLTVVFLAVVLLTVLSTVDWHGVSGGHIKNFNLVEDLYMGDTTAIEINGQQDADLIDPALMAAIDEVVSAAELPLQQLSTTDDDSKTPLDVETMPQDEVIREELTPPMPLISPMKIDGVLPIEDYTPDGSGLKRFAEAIIRRGDRRARIAVIGDSYIEGDIFTQDIRSLLQSEYGGNGVGYMSMHSDFPGFRRSVNQSDKGWTVIDMRNKTRDEIRPLSGEYCIGEGAASVTYKG